jgi:hypothetical protein
VNEAKVELKTVQGILRHANIQTTLNLYTQATAMKHARHRGNI